MNIKPEEFFSLLAHPLRLRTVILLRQAPELCVCDLTRIFRVAQPLMSRHLGPLRDAGVLVVRREGLWMHYRINPALAPWAMSVIAETERGLADDHPYRDDRAALESSGSAACPTRWHGREQSGEAVS